MRCVTVSAANVVLPAGFDTTWASVDVVNSPPNAPAVTIAFSTACGTAPAPTPVTDGAARRYSGTATDPDGDSVFTLLEIIRSDGTLAHPAEVGPTSSSSSFFWPEVPAGALLHGQTYRFRARSRDSVSTGPYSRDCFLTVDAVRPGVPRIESTDYPDGEPVILARTTGTVTLRPAASDTDVAEYLFSSQAETTTARIKAGPDGAAVLQLTVFENPVPTSRLFVKAVDRAGNVSPVTLGWGLSIFDNPACRHMSGAT